MFRTRELAVLIVLLFALAVSAEAQTRLTFPRVLSADELATTGFALVNTSSATVAATLSFYGADGILVVQSVQNVPGKGQLARLASEIFPSVKVAGWVQIVSSSTELQGFELVGDFAKVVDGAGPAAEGRQLALIDFSRDDVLHIVNTTSQSGTAQVTLNDASGQPLGTRSIPLTAFQPAALRLGDVHDDNNIDLVTISADVNISASMTTKLPGGLDIGLTNAAIISGAPSTLFFPFAPNGTQGASNWTTYLGISNLATATQTVSLTFTPDTGSAVTIQRTLTAGASVGDTVANLFGISASAFAAGWIRVTGSAGLAGVAAYQDSANGALAIVPSQSSGATAFFFGHIASLSPWYTGIGLLNATTTAANAEIYAIDGNGQLVGTVATFSVPAGRRTSLLSEFVPQVLQRASDGGWVFVRTTNNVPLLGFELFGHAILPILANVQGFALPSGSSFTPPGSVGGGTSTANIEKVSITDSNSAPKTAFVPGDTMLFVATITNSGPRETAQLTFAVTDPRNNTFFTNTTSITLPAVSGDIAFSGFIPTNALNGQYTFTATLVHQGKTVTKSTTFTVSGGTSTPSVGQETPTSLSVLETLQRAFRPGSTVRFSIPIVNFTGSAVTAVLSYQLTGPGLFNAGSGSQNFSVPAGLSYRSVDMIIPAAAQQGLFVFTSNLTVSGAATTRGRAITVVPANPSEAIEVDVVFAADVNGIPRGGFTPGTTVLLNARRVSTFGVSTPATIRYTVTDPNSATVLEQSGATMAINGGETRGVPFTLSADAPAGTYTYRATITYQDSTNTTKTSTAFTTFVVGSNPPALPSSITAIRQYVTDINLIARTSYSNGEIFVLAGSSYSTNPSPSAGTALFQIKEGNNILLGATFNFTFNPGINSGFVPISTAGITIPSGTTLTFALTVTIQGIPPTTNSTDFRFTAPDAPPLNFVNVLEEKVAATAGQWMAHEDGKTSGVRLESFSMQSPGR
jgi:hypothetical protein